MEKPVTIYAIVNLTNGKAYYGLTSRRPKKRWNEHRSLLVNHCHHAQYLQRSWDKHGADSFRFVVLKVVPFRAAAFIERFLVESFDCYNCDLNPDYNGSLFNRPKGGPQKGCQFTEEHKQALSDALRGRKLSEQHRENKRKSQTGLKRSPEARARMAEAQRARRARETGGCLV